MTTPPMSSTLLKRIILHAAKWPAVYIIIGVILTVLSYIDDIVPLTQWKHIFDFTDKAGNLLILVGLIVFLYNLFVYLCLRYERKIAETHKIASLILSNVRRGSRIIFILVVIDVIITVVSPGRTYLVFANNIVDTILIISIGWIAIQVFYTIEAVIYQHMLTLTDEKHLKIKALYTKMHILRNIATVLIVVITIAAILMSFSSVRNIGISLLASAGFLTAIIGLSAQKTLFSLFSGLQIALAQPIKIGDVVVIEKESGIIEEITFTYVTLKLGDRRRLVVPINYFVEKPFENWSHEGENLRSSFHFHVDFLMPIAPLRKELERILQRSPLWDGKAQKLQVANLHDRSVEIRVQLSASNADNLSDLRADVREKILEFIRENYAEYFPKFRFNNNDLG